MWTREILRLTSPMIIKTANEICNNPDGNRIKLNEQHTGYIMESNDTAALECLGWAIERHINDIPSKLKPTFRKFLKIRDLKKKNLER